MSELFGGANEMVRRFDSVSRRFTVASVGVVVLLLAVPLQAGEANEPATAGASEIDVSANAASEGTCVESPTVMCLVDGRYEATIEVTKHDGEVIRATVARPRTRDSGLFWFFSENNWEVLLKVLDGCSTNGHHWVYAASASDVGMTLVVRDTTLPNQDADGTMIVNSRTYEFPPHSRRPQRADESDEDYQDNVLAKGHAALTESGAFPDACAKTL